MLLPAAGGLPLPQADTTLKYNITCHPPSVPTTLFIKGSRRE